MLVCAPPIELVFQSTERVIVDLTTRNRRLLRDRGTVVLDHPRFRTVDSSDCWKEEEVILIRCLHSSISFWSVLLDVLRSVVVLLVSNPRTTQKTSRGHTGKTHESHSDRGALWETFTDHTQHRRPQESLTQGINGSSEEHKRNAFSDANEVQTNGPRHSTREQQTERRNFVYDRPSEES